MPFKTLTQDEISKLKPQDQIEYYKAENSRLTQEAENTRLAKQAKVTCKVGKQGGVSVYGLQRFPVTLYANGWNMLSEFITSGGLAKFMELHKAELATGSTDIRFAAVRAAEAAREAAETAALKAAGLTPTVNAPTTPVTVDQAPLGGPVAAVRIAS